MAYSGYQLRNFYLEVLGKGKDDTSNKVSNVTAQVIGEGERELQVGFVNQEVIHDVPRSLQASYVYAEIISDANIGAPMGQPIILTI